MPGIRFDGLSTGIQTSELISALLDYERRPLTLIEARQSQVEQRQELFRTLNTNLVALKDAAKAIDNQNSVLTGANLNEELLAFKATSSNENIVTATASGDASPGSLDIRVDRLAQAGRQVSFGFATDTEIVAAAGETLSIDFGGASPIDITVGAGGATLRDLRDLVNADLNNGGSVRADVLFDGTAHRLVVASTQTGVANDLVVTTNVTGPGGVGPLFDAALTQNASDAQLEILGVAVTRPSNTITDLFGGITLELHGAHDPLVPTERATIDVERNDEAIEEKLQTLVDSYNTIRQFAIDQSSYNETAGGAGLLSGDSTLRSIDSQVRTALSGRYAFAGNPFTSISEIGLSFDAKDGMLSLDSDKLHAAFDQDAASVRELLAGHPITDTNGIMTGDGVASALARSLEIITLDDQNRGTIAIRDAGFDRQIAALDESIQRFERRLAQREELLVQRFSRLESLISGLQAQGNYVSAAFTNSGF